MFSCAPASAYHWVSSEGYEEIANRTARSEIGVVVDIRREDAAYLVLIILEQASQQYAIRDAAIRIGRDFGNRD